MRPLLLGLLAVSAMFGYRPVLVVGGPGSLSKARGPLPRAPYFFISEDKEGTSPKVLVRDARGALWNVKFGEEVKAEVFATKVVSALGYYADVTHYVDHGRIIGARNLKRARRYIDAAGRFRSARFEYRDPALQFLRKSKWTWQKNPFIGTRELTGLKILIMLLSNWDNKDGSNVSSNTGVLGQRHGKRERIYYVTDWGGSMGKWGRICFRSKWDCEEFARQGQHFIKKVDDGEVEFGFSTSYHANEFKNRISVADVRWIAQRLRRISDAQLRTALLQSGATVHEARHFSAALRLRMHQLDGIAR
jgi:hypothetical protein